MTVYLSLLVSLVGLVIFLATNTKLQSIGKAMFWVGLLVFLLKLGETKLTLP